MATHTPAAAPRPTRAFLLPTQGEPQEFWIPVEEMHARPAIERAIGNAYQREWPASSGKYVLLTSLRSDHWQTFDHPVNAVLGRAFKQEIGGPVVVARMKRRTAEDANDVDNADPDSDYLSIPASVKPSEWKTLFDECA